MGSLKELGLGLLGSCVTPWMCVQPFHSWVWNHYCTPIQAYFYTFFCLFDQLYSLHLNILHLYFILIYTGCTVYYCKGHRGMVTYSNKMAVWGWNIKMAKMIQLLNLLKRSQISACFLQDMIWSQHTWFDWFEQLHSSLHNVTQHHF